MHRPVADDAVALAEVQTQPVLVYRAREGGMGVLQVLGPSQDPRNLRIRFKAALSLQCPGARPLSRIHAVS